VTLPRILHVNDHLAEGGVARSAVELDRALTTLDFLDAHGPHIIGRVVQHE